MSRYKFDSNVGLAEDIEGFYDIDCDPIDINRNALPDSEGLQTLFQKYGKEKEDGFYADEEFKIRIGDNKNFRTQVIAEISTLSRVLSNPHLQVEARAAEYQAYLQYYARLCRMMSEFYDDNHNRSSREKYKKLGRDFEETAPLSPQTSGTYQSIKHYLHSYERYTDDKATGFIGMIHFYRIFGTFATLVLKYSWDLCNVDLASTSTDYMAVQSDIFHGLSVALPFLRLIINAKHVIQHHDEMTSREMRARGFQIFEDLLWGLVNLFTNYSKQLGLLNGQASLFSIIPSLPIADLVTVGFLAYDIARNFIEWAFIERPTYVANILALDKRIRGLKADNSSGINDFEIKVAEAQLIDIKAQKIQKLAAIGFAVIAASFVAAGFAASMFFSGGLALPLCYAAVALGMALYKSADSFGDVVGEHKRIGLWARKLPTQNIGDAEKAQNKEVLQFHEKKRNDAALQFVNGLKDNILIPGLMITGMALSWQISLVVVAAVVVAMMALKIHNNFKQQAAVKEESGSFLSGYSSLGSINLKPI